MSVAVATQEQRRAQTREALLDAGAALFAERGVAGASVDAIAERAGRTSGALYDHFGSKEGLLFALLGGWVDDATAVITAEQATASTLDEWVAAMWRAVADPPSGDTRWIALEHELWSYAAQSERARRHMARRYRAAWDGIDAVATTWTDDVGDPGDTDGRRVGPAVIGVLMGLEMMRRIDPGAVPEATAVATLRAVLTAAPTHAAAPDP